MLSGSLSDRFGRRRVFQIGLVLFTAGSLLCSMAHSIGQLIGFRALQGLGASMLNPVALSIIANAFPEPKARAHAVGVWGAVAGVSLAIGPLIGGALTQAVGWRSIFWINLPIGLTAVALAARFVPESKAPRARAFDPVGQLLVFVGLASLTSAVIEGPHTGWTSCDDPRLVCYRQAPPWRSSSSTSRGVKHPLLDLRFFRSIPFSSATLLALCAFASFAGFLFLNALYLQQARGFSAFHTGLCTLPLAIMMMVSAPLSGRLVGRYGTRPSLLAAGAGFLLSTLMLTRLSGDTPLSDCCWPTRCLGWAWDGQPGDHQQRCCRYAFITSRGGGSDRIHRPAGGCSAGRGGRRHGGRREPRERVRISPRLHTPSGGS